MRESKDVLDICSGCGSRAFALQCAGLAPVAYCERDALQAAVIRSNILRRRLRPAPVIQCMSAVPRAGPPVYGVCATIPCSVAECLLSSPVDSLAKHVEQTANIVWGRKPRFVFFEMAPWVLRETHTSGFLRSLETCGYAMRVCVTGTAPSACVARAFVLGVRDRRPLKLCQRRAWARLRRAGLAQSAQTTLHVFPRDTLQAALTTAQPPSTTLAALLTLNSSLEVTSSASFSSVLASLPGPVTSVRRMAQSEMVHLPSRWVSSPLAALAGDRQGLRPARCLPSTNSPRPRGPPSGQTSGFRECRRGKG